MRVMFPSVETRSWMAVHVDGEKGVVRLMSAPYESELASSVEDRAAIFGGSAHEMFVAALRMLIGYVY